MKIEQIHKLFLTCSSACTDTRKIQEGDIFFALKGDNFNGNLYAKEALNKGAKFVVIDEKKYQKSDKTILVDDVLKTLQNLASYHRTYLGIPVIGLTGSNGKTTTKELINIVLSQKFSTTATVGNFNNHIGVPLTLLSMNNNTQLGIVEMGANHQKEIEFLCDIAKPDFGYITNFGKAHLEGFGGIEGVIKGKCELYNYLSENDKVVFVNYNDIIQVEKTKGLNRFSFGNDTEETDVFINFIEAKPYVSCHFNSTIIHSQLIGDYNYNNIAAAIAIGHYFKVDDIAIKKAIENYIPTNNRSQILQKGTNKIILDAYNANPTSMRAALLNFENQIGHKIAILGDMFELGDETEKEHQDIADLANSLKIEQVIFVGKNFYQTKNNILKASQFESFEDFKNEFNFSDLENKTLLIKGSRGMALERLLKL